MITVQELAVLNNEERQEAFKSLSFMELMRLRREAKLANLSVLCTDIKMFLNRPKSFTESYLDSLRTSDKTQWTLDDAYRIRLACMEHRQTDALMNAKLALLQMSAGGQSNVETTTVQAITVFQPPVIRVVVDHSITDTSKAEPASQEFAVLIHQMFGDKVKVSLHSGPYNINRMENDHVVLLALPLGFGVMKARGTAEAGKVIPYATMQ